MGIANDGGLEHSVYQPSFMPVPGAYRDFGNIQNIGCFPICIRYWKQPSSLD